MKQIIIYILIFSASYVSAQNQDLSSFFEKDSITIVITDSGLGGLSVVAELENNMLKSGHFAKINLIFANALFNEQGGYNSLSDRSEKIKIFNQVLEGIAHKYHPDLILIACNTLSVIYQETTFSKNSKIPIVGIVDIGVEQINTALSIDTNATVLIFGTETTIAENNYSADLQKLGISSDRIVSQACSQLQQYIENDPIGEGTEMLIMSYADEAIEQIVYPENEIYISLNCSHFGYSESLWSQAFSFSNKIPKAIINPNIQMAQILLVDKYANRYNKTDIDISVVSKVNIKKENAVSISEILKNQSIRVSKSLIEYQIVDDLF